MSSMAWLGCYFLYAFVQAVLIARYSMGVDDAATRVGAVVAMTVVAPIMTLAIVVMAFFSLVDYLTDTKG